MLLRTLLALLLTVAPASAQFVFSGGGSGGSGTVTTLSVATANGFAGTVATATTTPVITLTTSVTGNVCSNATALSACSTTGTGATVLASTPTLVTPVLGVASGTSLALGGATIGTNALAVTGTSLFNNRLTVTQGTVNQGLFASTGGSNTGADTTSAFDLAWTLNTSGSPDVFALRVTDTARGANTRLLNLYGGASGTTSQFSVDRSGVIYSAQGGNATIVLNGGFTNYGMGFGGSGDGLFILNNAKKAQIGNNLVLTSTGLYAFAPANDATAATDANFSRQAAGVIQAGSGSTANANGTIVYAWAHSSGQSRVSTQFDKTTDVTLANIPGLTVTVTAGKTYNFQATLYTSSNIAGGVQAAIAGTVTATTITYEGETTAGAAIGAQTRATALGTTVGGITTVTAGRIDITGTITVNAGGTLTVQFAQNASNAAASSVLVGSTFIVQEF